MKLFNIIKYGNKYFIFFKEEKNEEICQVLVLKFEDVKVNFRTKTFEADTNIGDTFMSTMLTWDLEKRITEINCIEKNIFDEEFYRSMIYRFLHEYKYEKIDLYSFIFDKEIIKEIKKLKKNFKDKIAEDEELKKAVLSLIKEIGLEEIDGTDN